MVLGVLPEPSHCGERAKVLTLDGIREDTAEVAHKCVKELAIGELPGCMESVEEKQ